MSYSFLLWGIDLTLWFLLVYYFGYLTTLLTLDFVSLAFDDFIVHKSYHIRVIQRFFELYGCLFGFAAEPVAAVIFVEDYVFY
jgi:hypothetical protein